MVALSIRSLRVPATPSRRSISASTWRVCPSTSALVSPATWPARNTKPLATTACDMRAPDSIRLISIGSNPSPHVLVAITQRQHQQQYHTDQRACCHDERHRQQVIIQMAGGNGRTTQLREQEPGND